MKKYYLPIALLIFTTNTIASETYKIKSGDTLWDIANRFTTGSVTTHQMIASIHEANKNILQGGVDRINVGMTLVIPSNQDAANADPSYATNLLSHASKTNYRSNQQAQAKALLAKIENIETEINQTMQDISKTKQSFENSSPD